MRRPPNRRDLYETCLARGIVGTDLASVWPLWLRGVPGSDTGRIKSIAHYLWRSYDRSVMRAAYRHKTRGRRR